jgi:hypothetical protein
VDVLGEKGSLTGYAPRKRWEDGRRNAPFP